MLARRRRVRCAAGRRRRPVRPTACDCAGMRCVRRGVGERGALRGPSSGSDGVRRVWWEGARAATGARGCCGRRFRSPTASAATATSRVLRPRAHARCGPTTGGVCTVLVGVALPPAAAIAARPLWRDYPASDAATIWLGSASRPRLSAYPALGRSMRGADAAPSAAGRLDSQSVVTLAGVCGDCALAGERVVPTRGRCTTSGSLVARVRAG